MRLLPAGSSYLPVSAELRELEGRLGAVEEDVQELKSTMLLVPLWEVFS